MSCFINKINYKVFLYQNTNLIAYVHLHERIPSVRELASSIEVNPNTVNRSYAYLQELGIIENKRGIGYFVTTDAVEKIISIKRKEFIELEIPRIAKIVRTLNLSFEEMRELITKQKLQTLLMGVKLHVCQSPPKMHS
jgi:DNA-binding transcriptional regulator YhcF (GntR family)